MIFTNKFYDTFNEKASASLAHHGTKGMKWGVWNSETQAKYGVGSALSRISQMASGGGGGATDNEATDSDESGDHVVKDLQDVIAKRVQEEKEKLAQQQEPKETKEEHDTRVQSLAYEVIRGDWGNGQERYDRLLDSGHSYSEVQTKVNDIIYGTNDYEAGNNTSGREDDDRKKS